MKRWDDFKARHISPERAARISAEVSAELGLIKPRRRWRDWLLGAWIVALAVGWMVCCMMASHAVFGVGPVPAPRLLPCGPSQMCPRLPFRDGLDAGAR